MQKLYKRIKHRRRERNIRSGSFVTSSFARRLSAEALEDRRMLATFSVTNLNDAGPGSLRDAILMANSTSGADDIDFSVTGTINLASQLPTITDALTIAGPGADQLTINAGDGTDGTIGNGDGFRAFNIDDGTATEINVNLSGLTITGGDVPFAPASGSSAGGGILNAENLTIDSVALAGNNARFGGALFNSGTALITRSAITGNNATQNGGGLENNGGILSVADSTISGNSAAGSGGGILNFGAAGVTSTLNLDNVTVFNNTAGNSGQDGVANFNGYSTAAATINNSIIADSLANDATLTGDFNLFGTTGDTTGGANDQTTADPRLGALADNGGPTQTHALLPDSPAINAGDPAFAPSGVTAPITSFNDRATFQGVLSSTLIDDNVNQFDGSDVDFENTTVNTATSGPTLSGFDVSHAGDEVTTQFVNGTDTNSTETGNFTPDIQFFLDLAGVPGAFGTTSNVADTGTITIQTAGVNAFGFDPFGFNDQGLSLLANPQTLGVELGVLTTVTDTLGNMTEFTIAASDPFFGVVSPIPIDTITFSAVPTFASSGVEFIALDNFLGGTATIIVATDQRGTGFDRIVGGNVDIGAVEAQFPVFTSNDNATVVENTQAVIDLTVTNVDQTPTFSIVGSGADNGLFEIVNGNQLQFIAAPDFENPLDVGGAVGDNVYEVTVQADAGIGRVGSQTLLVTVTEVAETLALVVDNTSDVEDGDFSAGQLSLREAIGIANINTNLGGPDTIAFDPTVFGTAQTITLGGTELTVTDSLDILPPTASLTIDANGQSRVLSLTAGTLNLEALTITGGLAASSTNGGGILIDAGATLNLSSSSVVSNTATGSGGGIFNSGTLTVINSTLSGNIATTDGGGLNNQGTATLTGATLSDNSAAGLGGGIFTASGQTTTLQSTIVANSASGGDLAGAGTLTGSFNLIEDGANLGGLADTVTGDPLLGPLSDNGGPTQTHALLSGSPAINAGDPAFVPVDGAPATDITSLNDRAAFLAALSSTLIDDNVNQFDGSDVDFDNNTVNTATFGPTLGGFDVSHSGDETTTQFVNGTDTNATNTGNFTPDIQFLLDLAGTTGAFGGFSNQADTATITIQTAGVTAFGFDPFGFNDQGLSFLIDPQALGVELGVLTTVADTLGNTTEFTINASDPFFGVVSPVPIDTITFSAVPTFATSGTEFIALDNFLGGTATVLIASDQRGDGFDRIVGGNVDIGAFEQQALDFVSAGSASVPENTQAVVSLAVADNTQTPTFSVAGAGADNGLFEVVNGNELQFIAAPDFENPLDVGGAAGDNIYEVSVQADDGNGNLTTQTIIVSVTEVAENLTLVVDNTSDISDGDFSAGQLSLREAIEIANINTNLGSPDTINFDSAVFATAQTIAITSALPNITDAVNIDATTLPGFTGTPLVALDGTAAGGTSDGLRLLNHTGSTIRGLAIHSFSRDGIEVLNGGNHTIAQNYVGLNLDGNAAGNLTGLRIGGSANGSAIDSNVVSGNNASGIVVTGTSTLNTLTNNLVGTDPIGQAARPNVQRGIALAAPGNIIGQAGAGNTISGNGTIGISLNPAADNTTIQGNRIGTNIAGDVALGNTGFGLLVNSENNQIGGDVSIGQGNQFSGNGSHGVVFSGVSASNNQAQGNLIGTDAAGTAALANGVFGVYITGANNVTIGSADENFGNLISGNVRSGVNVLNSENSSVLGNRIGTTADGNTALPNGIAGVVISGGSTGTLIADNQISGNTSSGIAITGATTTNNRVEGNFIGTNSNATAKLANGSFGILISAPNNMIGSTTAVLGNVITSSANAIALNGANATGNTISRNFIGTNGAKTIDLGTTRGILLGSNAAGNTIISNQIANNGTGVRLASTSGAGNQVTRNSFTNNSVISIDLADFGLTANDAGDADAGPNLTQNHPVIQSAEISGDDLIISFSVPTDVANATFPLAVEFYRTTGAGSESQFLRQTFYTTANAATGTITRTLANVITSTGLSLGDTITGTATDAAGNTSEFGDPVTLTGALQTQTSPPAPVIAPRTADLNGDGNVNGFDFLLWQRGVSSSSTASSSTSDTTASTDSQSGLAAFRSQYGQQGGMLPATRAALIDAAIALETVNDILVDASLQIVDELFEESIFAQQAAASDSTPTPQAATPDNTANTAGGNEDDSESQWLDDELLEAVFG